MNASDHRLSLWLVVPVAVAAALTWSCRREPDELLFMVGRTIDEKGAPLAGTPVQLLKNGSEHCYSVMLGGVGDDFDGGTFADAGVTTANQRGDFLFEMTYRDALTDTGSYRSPACFELRAQTAQARSTISFVHSGGDMEIADLPVTAASATAQQVDGGLLVQDSPPLALEQYQATLVGWDFYAGARKPAWVTQGTGSEAKGPTYLPPHLFEDFGPVMAEYRSLAVYERIPPPISLDGYLFFTLDVRADGGTHAVDPVVPVSRGAACTPEARDGGVCPLTDGKLDDYTFVEPFTPTPLPDGGYLTPPPPPKEIVLDLGAPKAISRVVIRGLTFSAPADDVLVEVSVDGTHWTRAAGLGAFTVPDTQEDYASYTLRQRRAAGEYADLPLATSGEVRYVRLRGIGGRYPNQPEEAPTNDVLFYNAQEISAF